MLLRLWQEIQTLPLPELKVLKRYWVSLITALIILNILLSAWWLLHGDIHYDVDISRDLLVIDDIVENKNITLLGPHSGAIPGVFHGPLWFYVNLPAFLVGGGNPLVVGWFWFLLSISFLWIVFYVTKKLFDAKTALLSVLLLSVNSIINPSIGLKNFYNPYGAVFFTPIFFWLFYQYINSLKVKYLIGSLLILGLIIQFQMAFGIPLLLIVTFLIIYLLFKKRKLWHLLSYFILLIPLSSFIVFDLKHDGLQIKALVRYLNEAPSVNSFLGILKIRINELIFNFFDLFSPGKNIITVFYAVSFLILFFYSFKKTADSQKTVYFLFGYLFFGFWVISLFYKGGIGNYFWPLLPLTIIVFCSFYKFLKREIFIIALVILYLVNLKTGISAILDFKTDVSKRGPHSWAFNLQVAKNIYNDAGGDFGYFTYSPDRFAYQQRYAMIFAKKYFSDITSLSSIKKPLTYLIEVDPPKDRPELSADSWRISDIGIKRAADQTFRFDFIQVEKYHLSDEEIKILANPLILDYMFVR